MRSGCKRRRRAADAGDREAATRDQRERSTPHPAKGAHATALPLGCNPACVGEAHSAAPLPRPSIWQDNHMVIKPR